MDDLTVGAGAVAALVRPVPATLASGERTHLDRAPIDVSGAEREHSAYTALLESLGLSLVWAAAAPELPDSVFVEDVAVATPEIVVLTRPGAPSRRPEVAAVHTALGPWHPVALKAPARLDGGDVLQVGTTVYAGRSSRTDGAGVEALRELFAPLGRRVVEVPVRRVLHLKSGLTALPDGCLVTLPGAVDLEPLGRVEVLAVPPEEPAGADVLVVRGTAVLAASAPRTAELIARRAIPVRLVEVAELGLAEAGVTCLSVLLSPPPGKVIG